MGFTAWFLVGVAVLASVIFVTSRMKKRRTVNTRAPEGERDDD